MSGSLLVCADYNIEHERDEDGEEIGFQIKWKPSS